MKNKMKLSLCFLLIFALSFASIACTEKIVNFNVTVTGGTGGGVFVKNGDCTAVATVEEGKQFVKWIDENGTEVSTSNPYSFKVNRETTLVAVIEDKTSYTVTIKGGGVVTGTTDKLAKVIEGQSVSVTLKNSNARKFKNWLINGTETSTDNPYIFTATKDMEITAIVDQTLYVAVEGGTIGEDGKVNQKFQMGEECTLTAAAPTVAGETFRYWVIIDENDVEKAVSSLATYKFAVTETEKYIAKYGVQHTVAVEGGYIVSGETQLSEIILFKGDTCTVKATIPTGQFFIEWVIDGKMVSKSIEYSFVISKDIRLQGISGSRIKHEQPVNTTNQLFNHKNDYAIVELDRMKNADGTSKTMFAEGVEYVMYYMYESPTANKEDYVGRFILEVKPDGDKHSVKLLNLNKEVKLTLEGGPGNIWGESSLSNQGGKNNLFNVMGSFVGSSFSRTKQYYFAAQACVNEDSPKFVSSDISDIGPLAFGPY